MTKQNILFIVADDLNSWIGALGRNPDVKTPNIDKLSRRGTLFSRAYCAAPYCNASRMSVYSGLLPSSNGVYHNEPFWENPTRTKTFVELLRDNGYYTFGAGKVFHGVYDYAKSGAEAAKASEWREIENRSFLWDEFITNKDEPLPLQRPINGMFDFNNFQDVPPMYHHFDWGPLPNECLKDMPDQKTADAVIEFIGREHEQPFFCAAGIYKPHLPWHVPQKFFDLYDVSKISLPLVKDDDLDDVPPIGKDWALSPRDHELITSKKQWLQAVHGYLAAISYSDYIIGQIVDKLEETGQLNNTTIILWSDNGFHLGEKLHWRKFALWEEATRVPLIIVKPNAPIQTIHAPVSLVDLYPTIAALCEIDVDRKLDGESLLPIVHGESQTPSKPAVMIWGEGNYSIRYKNWRYTIYSDGNEELYDHMTDPYEWTNLANINIYANLINSLKQYTGLAN